MKDTELEGLDLLLTYKCVSECEHCLYQANPRTEGVMDPSDAKMYLEQARGIQWIAIHGGEPFIYFENLEKVVKTAKEMGIDEIWVMTNSYWAKTSKAAYEKLSALKDAGCTHMWFSADSFHQAFIPLERVKIALEEARRVQFPTIVVNSLFLGDKEDPNEYNILTKRIVSELGDLQDTVTRWESFSIGVSLSVVGRAAERLIPHLEKRGIPEGGCVLPPYLGSDLDSPRAFEIDPFGWVLLCPGLSIGNAKKTPLSEIVATYNPSAIPILEKLKKEGPKGLLKEAVEKGYTTTQYVNECHLCYQLRKFLREDYSNLVPGVCYGA